MCDIMMDYWGYDICNMSILEIIWFTPNRYALAIKHILDTKYHTWALKQLAYKQLISLIILYGDETI